jgi:outer membrane usher protein
LCLSLLIPDAVSAAPARHETVVAKTQPGPTETLILSVYINGSPTKLLAMVHRRPDGGFAIRPTDLATLDIRPDPAAMAPDGLIDLDRLPGVVCRYDAPDQIMDLTVPSAARLAHRYDVDSIPESHPTTQGYGAVLNYTLFGTTNLYFSQPIQFDIEQPALSSAFDGWFYSRYGIFDQSAIVSTTSNDLYDSVRLDSSWSYSDPKSLLTFQAGDLISGGLDWTRPVRLAGFQIRRNFGLRPDLVTMPMPSLSGSAAVPSTLDVYADNVKVYSQSIPPGPFQVSNIPMVTGAGTASVVVRDSLGRATTINAPFYGSSSLLRQGISDFSVEAGFPRQFYGIQSNDYFDTPAASGSVRYGLSDRLTLEAHSEGTAGVFDGGLGAVFPLWTFGLASLSGSGSTGNAGNGGQVSAGLQLGPHTLFFQAYSQRAFGEYSDIASVTADTKAPYPVYDWKPPRATDQVSLSSDLPRNLGNLSLNFSLIDYSGDSDRTRVVGISYNRKLFGDSSLYASAFRDLDNPKEAAVYVGISIPLGRRRSLTVNGNENQDEKVGGFDLSQSETQEIGSTGWRIHDEEGDNPNRFVDVSYHAQPARLEAGLQQFDDKYGASLEADGAIVAADGGVFFANRVDDAFAVVDAGAPGVEVLHENRPIGKTNAAGKLLVTNLNSYQQNKISIDPLTLPIDANVPQTKATVVPADRSGAVVNFGVVTDAPAALVTFQNASGHVLDPGLAGTLDDSGKSFIIGYDGEAYIQGLSPQNRVSITLADGSVCRASFAFTPTPDGQTQIPGVVCR